MKIRTGGESPRPASAHSAVAVDLVKFQDRRSKSGWEKTKRLGSGGHAVAYARCVRCSAPWCALPGEVSGITSQPSSAEIAAIRRAIDLARRGPVGDNPQVGAVLLSNTGAVLGEGWHCGAGTPHAEVAALDAARAAGVDPRGATMVVSLEPCNHTGRTPPCTQALIDAGIARVIYALDDPTETAAGGAARLREAGISVVSGIGVGASSRLVGPWLTRNPPRRPIVTVKLAQTIDARVAAADGSSKWITATAAREHSHVLRASQDAIVIGTGTALADNPRLTVRGVPHRQGKKGPLRVVLGNRPVPDDAAVRGDEHGFLQLPRSSPDDVLIELARRGIARVLVEGGPTVASAFLRAQLVDEIQLYLAPTLLGAGLPSVSALGITELEGAQKWVFTHVESVGCDLFIVANRWEK